MKIMKKLMALVLASALVLTLLTGCSGGGGGGITKETFSVDGVTITMDAISDGTTSFDKAFAAETGENVKYDRELSQKAYEFFKTLVTVTDWDDDAACKLVGIDETKTDILHGIFEENETAEEQAEFMVHDLGVNGDKYGYAVAKYKYDNKDITRILMLVSHED